MTTATGSYQVVLIQNNGEAVLFAEAADLRMAMAKAYRMATGEEPAAMERTNPERCPVHDRAIPSKKHQGSYCPGKLDDGSYCKWERRS